MIPLVINIKVIDIANLKEEIKQNQESLGLYLLFLREQNHCYHPNSEKDVALKEKFKQKFS